MPHLLPQHDGLPTGNKGQWLDFQDGGFSSFSESIEIPHGAKINVTSIPSPWARMLLFEKAIINRNHLLHDEIMSNILDVLELIFYNKFMLHSLELRTINLNGDGANNFLNILHDLAPAAIQGQPVHLLMARLNVNDPSFVLAGLSPYTLFYTPLNLKNNTSLARYFKEPVYLKDRPERFQTWIQNIFLTSLRASGLFSDLVNALKFPDGITRNAIAGNANVVEVNSVGAFGGFPYDDILQELDVLSITSQLKIQPTKPCAQPPLAIDPNRFSLQTVPLFDSYRFLRDFNDYDLKKMDRSLLPGELLKYPWVLPAEDFLQNSIIKYKYDMNSSITFLGKNTDSYQYLLPLTEEYFRYFSFKDVHKYLKITEFGTNRVDIDLTIPLENGKEHIIRKSYSRANSQILEFDALDASTPLPHIILWPKLRPSDWNDSYYAFSYGKRFDDDSPRFDLQFLDKNFNSVIDSHSRRSLAVEVFRLTTLPSVITVEHTALKVKGMLLLDHESIIEVQANNAGATVGVDFGTSHTNIAINDGNNTSVLTYSSNPDGENINNLDFLPLFLFRANQIGTDQIPIQIKSYLKQFFFPNVLGTINDNNVVNLPLPSVINTDGTRTAEAIISASINFSKYVFGGYNILASQLQKNSKDYSNLKWEHTAESRNAATEYLQILLKLVRYELIKRGFDPDKTKYRWAYPKAFSNINIRGYENLWDNLLPKQQIASTDESKSALMYFNFTKQISAGSPSLSIVIDIGGGSSDISLWENGQIKLLFSTLWAGKNLVGYQDNNNNIHSVIYSTIKNHFRDDAARYDYNESFQTHLNYILSSVDQADLLNFVTTNDFYKGRFIILYFFSSLLYEIGLQSRRFIDPQLTDINICLAGNGSRFINWSSGNVDNIDPFDEGIYKSIIKNAFGLDNLPKIRFISSQNKKSEVAMGLCELIENITSQQPQNQAIITEDIKINGNEFGNGTEISEIGIDYLNQANQLSIDQNNSKLLAFHRDFFDILRNSDLYRQMLRQDNLLADLDSIERTIRGEWNNILGEIRLLTRANADTLGTLSSSIFILGMQMAIKKIHSYLD